MGGNYSSVRVHWNLLPRFRLVSGVARRGKFDTTLGLYSCLPECASRASLDRKVSGGLFSHRREKGAGV